MTTHWLPTGGWRSGRRFLGLQLWLRLEEERREFRPVVTGWTPANWVMVRRWRWATRAEMIEIGERIYQERVRKLAASIPMPAGAKPPRTPCPCCGS